jgi:hypothetical protein
VDFVVVGFGLGALGVLLGVVILGWLAPRAQRAAALTPSLDDAARCQVIAAEHRGTGRALLYSGSAMLLVTVGALGGSLDDRTGAFLVTTTATVAAVGILLAGYLQRARNPPPPRRRTRTAPAASTSVVTTPPIHTPSFLVDEPPWVQDAVPGESDVAESTAEILPADGPGGGATIAEHRAPLPPAPSGEDSSGAVERDSLADSSIAVETPASGIWQPAGRTSGNDSEDTDPAETLDVQDAGPAAPTAHLTESSPSGTDDEDSPPQPRS